MEKNTENERETGFTKGLWRDDIQYHGLVALLWLRGS